MGFALINPPVTGEGGGAEPDGYGYPEYSRAEALALDGADDPIIFMVINGERWLAEWRTGNRSADVTKDPFGIVFIPGNDDATGASGGWHLMEWRKQRIIRPEWVDGVSDAGILAERCTKLQNKLGDFAVLASGVQSADLVPPVIWRSERYGALTKADLTGFHHVIKWHSEGKTIIEGIGGTPGASFHQYGLPDLDLFLEGDNVRIVDIQNFVFDNMKRVFEIYSGNTDVCRYDFYKIEMSHLGEFIDTNSYANSRSTIVRFHEPTVRYSCKSVGKIYCDKLIVDGGWISSGSDTEDQWIINALASFNDCIFIPGGNKANGKSFVFYTDDDGDGGRTSQAGAPANDNDRGLHFNNCRMSTEPGSHTFAVLDYEVNAAERNQMPVVSFNGGTLGGYSETPYEVGASSHGLIVIKRWPGALAFSNMSFGPVGSEYARLVVRHSTLVSEPDEWFRIELDDVSRRSLQRLISFYPNDDDYTVADADLLPYIEGFGEIDGQADLTADTLPDDYEVSVKWTEEKGFIDLSFDLNIIDATNGSGKYHIDCANMPPCVADRDWYFPVMFDTLSVATLHPNGDVVWPTVMARINKDTARIDILTIVEDGAPYLLGAVNLPSGTKIWGRGSYRADSKLRKVAA